MSKTMSISLPMEMHRFIQERVRSGRYASGSDVVRAALRALEDLEIEEDVRALGDRWVNMPTDRHNRGGVFSFPDGHAEGWHWRWPKKWPPPGSYWKRAESQLDLADLRRLQAAALIKLNYRRQP
jgi:putative addiction module CopG family antidote